MSVAVVIPVYNHERFIRAAIESALAQTLPVDRIIVVDDGSTDRSEQAAREVGDPRIQVFSQPNSGAHVAQNRGIELARGFDFIALLNSDDIFHPERVEKCVALLDARPEVDIVVTGVRMIDMDGAELPPGHDKARWLKIGWQARSPDYAEWLGYVNFAKTTSNVVARTPYLLAHPFRPYRYVHDYFFLGQAAIERRIEVLPDPLLFYRTHTTNTIKSGAAGSVTREAMDMALALLRELAPLLAASADARRAAALFFRGMMEDNVDFRGATFIHLMAQLASRASEGEIAALLASLNVEQFPEMAEGSSRRMKNRAARRDHRRLIATVQSTRWYALGRVFGLSPRFHYDEAADPERNLSRLKTTVNTSRWLTLGRRLGVLYLPDL